MLFYFYTFTMKVLGVTLRDDLNASTHITGVLEDCSRSLYALQILRSHGLPPKALHEVARSTTLSRLMYAAPAWWGLASATDRERVDRFVSRTIRMGYLPLHTIRFQNRNPVFDFENRFQNLFFKIIFPIENCIMLKRNV